MAKTKLNLEKKAKAMPEFDEISPSQRVKSIKTGRIAKKKPKVKKEVIKSNSAEIENEIKEKKKEPKVVSTSDKLVKREVVKTAIGNLKNGIKKEIETNSKTAKNLFDEELRYGLNVVAVKVPVCPPHARKILLTHSLYEENPDVCFIICDAIPKKGDQDETVRVFKEKLQTAGISSVTHVMTLGQLKRDYNTHNMKLKLCNTYDVFLVESKIAEHVYTVLGKTFIKKRKRPFQVDANNEKSMKISIDNALKKSTLKISPKSHLSAFEVGTAKMDNGKIADNIMSAIEQLKEKWPGGLKNISRVYLKPMQPSKISIPIYASEVNPNEVEIPVIAGAKQNRLDKLQAKLKKKSDKISVDVKSKKITRNRAVKAENEIKEPGKKRKNEDQPEKPKKKEKAPKVVEEVTVEEPAEKKKKKERAVTEEEKPAKKDKKKNKSDEKLQAESVADVFDKKKKKKAQETPEPEPEKKKKKAQETPEPEPEKKKKKKLETPEVPVEKLKPEKKKKQKIEPEEIPQDPPKAKNKKQKTGVAETEKEQTIVKKIKTKKNKT